MGKLAGIVLGFMALTGLGLCNVNADSKLSKRLQPDIWPASFPATLKIECKYLKFGSTSRPVAVIEVNGAFYALNDAALSASFPSLDSIAYKNISEDIYPKETFDLFQSYALNAALVSCES